MPSEVYEIVDNNMSEGWRQEKMDELSVWAYPSLHDGSVEVGIIDDEEWALAKYLSEVSADNSFPSDAELAECNKKLSQSKQHKQYEADLKMAKERGYEYPAKPE